MKILHTVCMWPVATVLDYSMTYKKYIRETPTFNSQVWGSLTLVPIILVWSLLREVQCRTITFLAQLA